MRIQTPRESRREIVGRISERLGIPARYEGAPGFAYTIGEITVERDGGIVSGNDALLESLKPMLVEQGWLEAGPVDEQVAVKAALQPRGKPARRRPLKRSAS